MLWRLDEKQQDIYLRIRKKFLHNFQVSENYAKRVIDLICELENLEPIALKYEYCRKTISRGFLKRLVLGCRENREFVTCGQSDLRKKHRCIYLYKDGHCVDTLLHEIAHFMPGSLLHNKAWIKNFLKLVNWHNKVGRII